MSFICKYLNNNNLITIIISIVSSKEVNCCYLCNHPLLYYKPRVWGARLWLKRYLVLGILSRSPACSSISQVPRCPRTYVSSQYWLWHCPWVLVLTPSTFVCHRFSDFGSSPPWSCLWLENPALNNTDSLLSKFSILEHFSNLDDLGGLITIN